MRAGPLLADLTEDDLNGMSKEELVAYALDLQVHLKASLPKQLSPEEVKDKARKTRTVMIRGIEKLMKWTTSCKRGSARFAYDGMYHEEAVFKSMLRLPEDHSKKMFKIPTEEFHNTVGRPQASVRYGWLGITGKDVNVRWSPEEKTFKVSATYGLPARE